MSSIVTHKIGVALGGGGARGLAHISLLEVFDELGIEIHSISGTSVGAIIGALYASGLKGVEIREWANKLIINKDDTLKDIFQKREAIKSLEFFDISFHQTGMLKGKRFLKVLEKALKVNSFEELEINLKIVSSDFWNSTQVIHQSGSILDAVRASMSLPGVFTPVEMNGKILVDGGGTNPVPHDLLSDCETVIAFDVMGFPAKANNLKAPNLVRSTLGMFDIMQNTIIEERLKTNPPNLYIKPDLRGIDLLDFYKAPLIYEQTEPAAKQLEDWLIELMEEL